MDANLAWTRPRYSDNAPAGNQIPNAVQKIANAIFTLRKLGPWSGSLAVRYIGAANLIEDSSVRSASSVTVNFRINRKVSNNLHIALDVLNLAIEKITISAITISHEFQERHQGSMTFIYTRQNPERFD
jgi:outer membrane receptor protein involved in Fe transport